ncbi:MAG: FecR family protein [Candidatus Cyclobacteriaceae bacterium M3_2C_046]
MKYKDYQLEDLLSNQDFIHWVTNPTQENDYFWKKWLEVHASKKPLVEQAKQIILAAKFKEDEGFTESYNRILHDVLKDKYSKRFERSSHRRSIRKQEQLNRYLRVAAIISFIFMLGLVLVLNQEKFVTKNQIEWITYSNPGGKKSSIVLPDSSLVILNAASKLAYSVDFDHNRLIKLDGEAYFDVKHNPQKPFVVSSKSVETTVLGTTFNVAAFENEQTVNISLNTGKIKVSLPQEENNSYWLDPGEKLVYDVVSGNTEKTYFDPLIEFSWKNNILVFDKASLGEFIRKIERWYGVQVVIKGNPNESWQVNGRFKNESLRLIMESLRFTHQIDYKVENNQIYIYFN